MTPKEASKVAAEYTAMEARRADICVKEQTAKWFDGERVRVRLPCSIPHSAVAALATQYEADGWFVRFENLPYNDGWDFLMTTEPREDNDAASDVTEAAVPPRRFNWWSVWFWVTAVASAANIIIGIVDLNYTSLPYGITGVLFLASRAEDHRLWK